MQNLSETFRFKFIGNFDVSNFRKKIDTLTTNDWEEYTFRQKRYKVHEHTHTIPLLFHESFINVPKKYPRYEMFEDEAKSLIDFLYEKYNGGKVVRLLLVKLLANSYIPKHVDKGDSLTKCHRHHIPVITHENIHFTIDDEVKYLKESEVWEINNSLMHKVVNPTNIDRVHILVDWIV